MMLSLQLLLDFGKRWSGVALLLVVLLCVTPGTNGQTITGQISGSVADKTGALIPGATVQLNSDLTGRVSEIVTDETGGFVFTQLLPGTYSLRVALTGFKAYEQKAIEVSATEHIAANRAPSANLLVNLAEIAGLQREDRSQHRPARYLKQTKRSHL